MIAVGVDPVMEGRRAGSFEGPGIEDWFEREEGGRIEEGGWESEVEMEERDLAVKGAEGMPELKPNLPRGVSAVTFDEREG